MPISTSTIKDMSQCREGIEYFILYRVTSQEKAHNQNMSMVTVAVA